MDIPLLLFPAMLLSPVLVFHGLRRLGRVWHTYQEAQRQRRWPTTYGKVLSAEVMPAGIFAYGRHGQVMDGRYQARVAFEYTVAGQTYTAQAQPAQAGITISAEKARETAANHYPPGQTVLVHYNPARPAEAMLPRQIEWIPELARGVVELFGGGLFLGYAVVFIWG